MKNRSSWTEFGEGKYPDCHYEGRQWPGSIRELVLNGFVEGTYLRALYPVRSIEGALSVKEGAEIRRSASKTCSNCANWIQIDASSYEGICGSEHSLASTADTVEAQFSCEHWTKKDY